MVDAVEVAKTALKAAQVVVNTTLPLSRAAVMQDVANANYNNDGSINVDLVPLPGADTFDFYGPSGKPFMRRYTDDERTRMANMATSAVALDNFTPSRSWSDHALVPNPACLAILQVHFDYVDRVGSTTLVGFDQWRAQDQASFHTWTLQTPKWGLPYCEEESTQLGSGSQTANTDGSMAAGGPGSDWYYSGIPNFLELSADALASDDPRTTYAVRLTRDPAQTATSEGRSAIRSTGRLNAYVGAPGGGTYAAVAAAEVFFARPTERADGKKELGSLFNPYWQVHLIQVPSGVLTAAQVLQGAATP